ncbi:MULTISPECIES: hypothetical protein [Myroides]|uniref:hypothetical protein n=1 Tax=Myroides TaxID=76831 RepID=UPI001AA1BE34|nr:MULTISPECIES: hypothetical protein [Myroides]UVD80389.1 hypothetical protein NWE55_03720 [Myroides albus]
MDTAYGWDSNGQVDVFGLSSFDPFEFGFITSFPDNLHFGQQRVTPNFSDIGSQAHPSIRGRAISDVGKDIAANRINPNIFLISYTVDPTTGKAVTLNNRGLAALSEGGKMPSDAIFVPFDKVPERLKKDFGLLGYSNEVVPSKSIAVTQNKDGTGLDRIIKNYT